MEIKDRILVVEDDKRISSFFKTVLESNRYDVIMASTGSEAYSLITSQCPDLVILDLGLPDMDGMNILRSVREWSSMPVIVVSARTHEKDKVEALDLGADDYVTKPFGMMELISRIKAVLRRSSKNSVKIDDKIALGHIVMDVKKHEVQADGRVVTLTLKEFELLKRMMKNPDIVLTRDQLLEDIWGYDFDGETRTVDVHVRTLRQKLGDAGEQIQTVRGVGYRMSE